MQEPRKANMVSINSLFNTKTVILSSINLEETQFMNYSNTKCIVQPFPFQIKGAQHESVLQWDLAWCIPFDRLGDPDRV